MRKLVLALIRFYQKYLSFDQGTCPELVEGWAKKLFITDKVCRFSPTCSEYTWRAVFRYGTLRGLWLGLKRVLRCHPWSKGGSDPVP